MKYYAGLFFLGGLLAWSPCARASVTRTLEALPDGRVRACLSWQFAAPLPSGLVLEEHLSSGWAVETLTRDGQPFSVRRETEQVLKVALGGGAAVNATGSIAYVLAPSSPEVRSVRVDGVMRQLLQRRLDERATGGVSELTLAPPPPELRIVGFRRTDDGQFELQVASEGASPASWSAETQVLRDDGSDWVGAQVPEVPPAAKGAPPLLRVVEAGSAPGALFRITVPAEQP